LSAKQIEIVNEITGRRNKKFVYVCEQCNTDFLNSRKSDKIRFCSNSCVNQSQTDGVLKHEKEQHFLSRYGVKNPFASQEVIGAREEKLFKQRGVKNVSQLKSVKAKKAATFMLNYGTTNNFGRQQVRVKVESTLLERYGTVAPTTCESVKEKLRSPQTRAKRFASWKRTGSIRTPAPEKRLVKRLSEKYGVVDSHVTVNGWSIDAFVKEIDTYVQCDGVWWHGLDRPISEIERLAILRQDSVHAEIYRKYNRDKAQNEWFVKNDMCLVRVTDRQINAMDENSLSKWCDDLSTA